MSLRARVLAGVALVALVLVIAAVTVSRTTEDYLVAQVDQQLDRAARQGDAPAASTADRRGERLPRTRALTGPESPSSLYVAVVSDGALRTVRLPNLTRDRATAPDLSVAEVEALAGQGIVTVSDQTSDLRYRATVTRGPRLTVIYALPLEDTQRAVRRLQIVELFAIGAVMAVLGLVAFWVLRLGVRPVKEMTTAASAIGGGELSHRIPASAPGTEAGDLGLALNAMLARLEGAFDDRSRSEGRLRQFVADASHELRTPITTIRGYAELYRAGGLGDDASLGEAMRRTEQEAVRMGSLVEDLLNLARLDQGRPLERAPLDLAAIVGDAGLDAQAVEPGRTVTVDAPAPVMVLGDEDLLRQVVANLVANARVHTPPDAALRLRAHQAEGRAVIEVTDEGPGMARDVADRAFERFYRADAARSRHTGGSGLGLSIVAAVAAAHGGTAEIASSPGSGTTVRIGLPVAEAAALPPPPAGR